MFNVTATPQSTAMNPGMTNQKSLGKRLLKISGIAVALLVLLFAASAFLATFVWNGLDAGQPAPDFSGHDLNGKPIRLADYAGKPVMLTFWSPECGACREELPALQAIATDPNANVTLVTIVSGMPAADVQQFVQQQGLTFPVLVDEPGNIAKAYEITGIPVSYFINPDGKIDHNVIGAGGKNDLHNNLFAWLNTCKVNTVCK